MILFNSWDLEKLLSTTHLTFEEKDTLIIRYLSLDVENEFESDEIQKLNSKIFDCQVDPILMGWNYGTTDIVKHLKKLR